MPDRVDAGERPTLSAIAARAGVSIATVSRVLNGRGEVSPQTRTLVESLLADADYVPPGARRTARHEMTVQYLVREGLSPYLSAVLNGVLGAATELGVTVAVGRPRSESPQAWAQELAQAGRTGVIAAAVEMTAAQIDALAEVDVPLVIVDPMNLPHQQINTVVSTNFAGAFAVTQHLLELGHRRIAFVGGPVGSTPSRARLYGYRSAMEGAGLEASADLAVSDQHTFEAGERAGNALLELSDPPTAIVGASDSIALGVIHAARSRGLLLPADLSVTGFDDLEEAMAAFPRLTTVHQPLPQMGAAALDMLLRMSRGETLESRHVEIPTELIVRSSTCAPSKFDR